MDSHKSLVWNLSKFHIDSIKYSQNSGSLINSGGPSILLGSNLSSQFHYSNTAISSLIYLNEFTSSRNHFSQGFKFSSYLASSVLIIESND